MNSSTMNWPQGASVYKDGRFYTLSGKPVNEGVAMDVAHQKASVDDAAVAAKITRAKRIVARNAEDDAVIASMFPALVAAVAEDGKEEEQKALFSEPEAEDVDTVAAYNDALKTERERWNGIVKRNRQRSQFAGATGRYAPVNPASRAKATAADSVKANARKARQYSAFATSAQLCKTTA